MNRRTFNQALSRASLLLMLNPKPDAILHFGKKGPMDRIGMSTVNFRERFPGTRSKDRAYTGQELSLMEVPEYFADRFHLHNVEFWSKHFASIEPAYIKELKQAIKKSKSRLINIQFDENYQIGDPDVQKRRESLDLALKWLDVAKTLGAGAFRVNPGRGDLNLAIDSLKIINEKARKKKIVLMTENHFGMEMDPEVHLKIVQTVGTNMYTLPDFGNYPDEFRYAALAKIMPYAYQMSVKTIDFDEEMNHTSFDFDRCMKMAVNLGFKGIYSVEQWSPKPVKTTDEAIADWMIEKVRETLNG